MSFANTKAGVSPSSTGEQNILVLQGGGALGAYQAGVFEALCASSHQPTWVAGMSIGAINAALICGNAAPRRVARLREFWEGVSAASPVRAWVPVAAPREALNASSAAQVLLFGVPGFFAPRCPAPPWLPRGTLEAISWYDTTPLRDPDARVLAARLRSEGAVDVVHLIYRRKRYETDAKDYEFSRLSMVEDWDAGHADMAGTLRDPRWLQRRRDGVGVQVFDVASDAGSAGEPEHPGHARGRRDAPGLRADAPDAESSISQRPS